MHGIKKLSLAMFTFMMATSYVNASSACSTKEVASLNREVANIKAEYEIAEKNTDWSIYAPPDGLDPEDYDKIKTKYIKINIANLTDNFYLEVTNNANKNKWTVTSETLKDGALPFDWEDLSKVTKFTLKVKTSDKTGCSDEIFRTLVVNVPRYNIYSEENICDALPDDYYLCQDFVTFKEIDSVEFYDRVSRKLAESSSEEEEKKDSWIDKPISFIKKHKVAFIIVGGVVIVAIVGGVVYIMKKRKGSKEI